MRMPGKIRNRHKKLTETVVRARPNKNGSAPCQEMVVAFHELEAPTDLATQLRVLADELAAVEAARAEDGIVDELAPVGHRDHKPAARARRAMATPN